MNPYDRRRWFGALPELPEDARQRDPDRIFSELKEAVSEHPGEAGNLSALLVFALTFSRLDSYSDFLSPEERLNNPTAILHRGHLRFYRAMAEHPDSPDSMLCTEAAADFREAAQHSDCAHEALAALARITAIEGGAVRGLASLRRLERFGSSGARRAAVGLRLYMADLPGTGLSASRHHLKKARRHLRQCSISKSDRILLAEINLRLRDSDASVFIWKSLEEEGCHEATYRLLRQKVIRMKDRLTVPGLLKELRAYKDLCPMDPRAYMLEGELVFDDDPEAGRMAWRGALVLDDRFAPAWGRLGDLYRDAWEQQGDEHGETWLEAASDSYMKAVSLAPLESRYRSVFGQIEREAGRAGRAVSTLTAALALVRDNPSTRRFLALSWTDLAYSPDLAPEARSAAAGRARSEWMRLLERGRRLLFDVIGLCRAVALEYAGTGGLSPGGLAMIDSMIPELERGMNAELAVELIPLAEDFLSAGLVDRVSRLLDCGEKFLESNHSIMALRAAVVPADRPDDAIRLYISAARSAGETSADFPEWMRRAASIASQSDRPDEAVQILRQALEMQPGNRSLLKDLAENLTGRGREDESRKAYRKALDLFPLDTDLLDDAIWHARENEDDDAVREYIDRALDVNPDNGGSWNQLGVHMMETGWNDEDGVIILSALNEAIQAYRKALDLDPGNSVYRGNLGDALRQSGDWPEATELLEEVVAEAAGAPGKERGFHSTDGFALNSLGRLEDERSYSAEGSATSAGDWENAGMHYRQAVERTGENPDYLRDYAWWLYRERRLEEAAGMYRRAAVQDPGDETLPYGESTCWRELGEEGKAMDTLDKALAIRTGAPEMMADKAELLGFLGDRQAADRLFLRVLEVSEGDIWLGERYASYLENTARMESLPVDLPVLDAEGRFIPGFDFVPVEGSESSVHYLQKALSAWEAVLPGQGDERRVSGRIGVILAALGRSAEAEEHLRASLTHSLRDAEAVNLLGRISLDSAVAAGGPGTAEGRTFLESAGHRLKAAVEYMPQNPLYHAHLAYFHVLESRWDLARRHFAEASGRDEAEFSYSAHTGIAALLAGEPDTAVGFLERIVSDGSRAEWLNALGLALLASGVSGAAVDAFRSACLADPESEIYPANLAMAHAGLNIPRGPLQ